MTAVRTPAAPPASTLDPQPATAQTTQPHPAQHGMPQPSPVQAAQLEPSQSPTTQAQPPERAQSQASQHEPSPVQAPELAGSRRARPRKAKRDPEATKADLVAVASQEFARLGFYGARVDEIAARSATTKRMIYYYFGDKEGLFTATLEQAYADIRAVEREIDVDHLPPLEALAALIRVTFEHHDRNPHLARLVTAENALGAVHLHASERITGLSAPVLALLEDILDRGRATGDVRRDVRPIDLHLMMSSLALFRITNQPTIEANFGHDMADRAELRHQIDTLTSMVLTWLATPEPPTAST